MNDDRSSDPTRKTRQRKLDRPTVIAAALESIDRDGCQGLTMRGLGKALNVEAMSLYRYATGREDVLEGVVGLLLEDITAQLDSQPFDSWQGYLQHLAHAVRDVALAHPNAFPLVATRHPAAPWLRPPLRSIEVVEHFLRTLGGFGFPDDLIVSAYRSFSSLLLGHLLLTVSTLGAETSASGEPLDEGEATIPNEDGRLGLSPDSEIVRLKGKLSEDHEAEEFEAAMESLLERIELRVSQ